MWYRNLLVIHFRSGCNLCSLSSGVSAAILSRSRVLLCCEVFEQRAWHDSSPSAFSIFRSFKTRVPYRVQLPSLFFEHLFFLIFRPHRSACAMKFNLHLRNTYGRYVYIYIYIYEKSTVRLTSVGLAHARPNYLMVQTTYNQGRN